MTALLTVTGAALCVAETVLAIYGRWLLTLVASWLSSGCWLVVGIAQHIPLPPPGLPPPESA